MIRISALLIFSAVVNGQSASGKPDEIRYDRTEGFGRTVSRLIIRPDSLLLRKYATHPRDNGDTIGVFMIPSTRKRFDSLWTMLAKGKPAKGIAPDTKVISIEARKNGKPLEFQVPVRPPIPEWARAFNNRIGDLQVLAEAGPHSTLALKEKIAARGGAQSDSLWLENTGVDPFIRTMSCTLTIEGANLAATGAGHGMKWSRLADTTLTQGISLGPKKPMPFGFELRSVGAGKWYLRAKWDCGPDPKADDDSFREEVYSPLDSVEIGPG